MEQKSNSPLEERWDDMSRDVTDVIITAIIASMVSGNTDFIMIL